MRTLFIILGLSVCCVTINAQSNDTLKIFKKDSTYAISKGDSTQNKVLGDKPEVKKSGDTTRIKLGNKGIVIVEKNGKTTVDITNPDKENKEKDKETYGDHVEKHDFFPFKDDRKHFEVHYAGIELGMNAYFDKNFNTALKGENKFMDLNSSRSLNVNINLIEYGVQMTENSGFATGMGLEINSYSFDHHNNITKDSMGIIVEDPALATRDYSKSKLKIYYLNIPLLYEVQFPIGNKKKPFYISAGIMASYKLCAVTKQTYTENNKEQNKNIDDDFNLTPLRLAYHFRMGYRGINLFATVSQGTLFEKTKGPELYPYEIGIMLLNF